jgi:hypothetical protein
MRGAVRLQQFINLEYLEGAGLVAGVEKMERAAGY